MVQHTVNKTEILVLQDNHPSAVMEALEVDHEMAERALGNLMRKDVDVGELYFQKSINESWSLVESKIKEMDLDIARGVGARALKGEVSGYAYADEIEPSNLISAAKAAASITSDSKSSGVCVRTHASSHGCYAAKPPFGGMRAEDKVQLLQDVDAKARSTDPRVKEVVVSLAASHNTVMVIASDGTFAVDVRPLVRLNLSLVMEKNGRKEQGTNGIGGRMTLYELLAMHDVDVFVAEAVRRASVNMGAVAAPCGEMDVVLGPGWPGIMLHEAVGHGLEGDFCRKKTSVFSGRVGELVASPLVTVVDDGTLALRRGSLGIDDEGVGAQSTVLIEKGILKGFMYDKLNARLCGTTSTGNGRRQSYAHQPMPRMTNTFMLNGDSTFDEMIGSVKRGVYAVNFSGGQVDITSGQFVFSASESYLIEDGKISKPIKGVSLIGSGPQVLQKIKRVGNDMRLDDGIGTCGKNGQSVPVGVGQPSVLISELTVGGFGDG